MEDRKIRIIAKSIAYALLCLNIKETKGANAGEVVNEILRQAGGTPGMPWCVATANFIYKNSCELFGIKPVFLPGLSSSRFVHIAEEKGLIVTPDKVEDGDFVVFKGEAYGTGYIHTGFVWTPVDPKGNYQTIEGNMKNTVTKVSRNLQKSPSTFIKLFS